MTVETSSWYIPASQKYGITLQQKYTLAENVVTDRRIGYYFPQYFRQSIEEVAKSNNISRWDVVRLIREGKNPESVADIRKRYQERILYIGCVHGASRDFIDQLDTYATAPDAELPHMILFGGDLTGAIDQRTIRQKQLFYDYLMNRAGPLLGTNFITQQNLLHASGDHPPADSPTVRDGAIKLLQFTLEEMSGYDLSNCDKEVEMKRLMLQQMTPGEPNISDNELRYLDTDEMLDSYIRWIRANKLNSGTWVGTLPKEIRQAYMNQYQQAAEALAKPLLRLKERNVEIVWVEGNEDNRLALDAISHGLDHIFDIQEFFERLGIRCERQIRGRDGKAIYHVLVPFFQLLEFETIPQERLIELQNDVKKAREQRKAIVMVAHSQLDWARHYPGQNASGYNAKVGENLTRLLQFFQPDELIHPHQHTEMSGIPNINAKYIKNDTVITYLPLLTTGELNLPIQDRKGRKIDIFGGKRQPVRRIT